MILLRRMNASMMPNMIQPQKKMLATDSTPTAATIVAVVTATLNAGAVPAMPMTADSKAAQRVSRQAFLL